MDECFMRPREPPTASLLMQEPEINIGWSNVIVYRQNYLIGVQHGDQFR
jgi:hypothetical protein